MFETERLVIREYRPTDGKFFLDIYSDFDVVSNLTMEFISPNRDNTRERIKRFCKMPLFVVAECKKTGAQIGFVHLQIPVIQNLDGELGIAVARKWWGKGYGTEIMKWLVGYSFQTMGLRRLSLVVFETNTGAVDLYEHVGFKHEGKQREALWKDGKWVDMIFMGVLSKEYEHANAEILP